MTSKFCLLLVIFFISFTSFSRQNENVTNKDSITKGKLLKQDALALLGGLQHAYTRPLYWKKDDWITAGAIVGGTALVYVFDEETNEFFTRQQGDIPKTIDDFAFRFGKPAISYSLTGGVYLYGLFTKNEKVRKTGVLLITSATALGVLQSAVKIIVGRARPGSGEGKFSFDSFNSAGRYHSFPSGHTVLSVTTAYAIGKQFKNPWVKGSIYAIGLITPASRLWSNAHWLTDVAFSAALSIVTVNAIDNYLNKPKDAESNSRKKRISWNFQLGIGQAGIIGTF